MADEKVVAMLARTFRTVSNGPEPGLMIFRHGDLEGGTCQPRPDDPGLFDVDDAECDRVASGVTADRALMIRDLFEDLESLLELARVGAGIDDEAWYAIRCGRRVGSPEDPYDGADLDDTEVHDG